MSNDQGLTLALLLTAGGAVAGAAFVTGLVQLLKNIMPLPGGPLRWAFGFAAVLVVAAYASGVQSGAITVSLESLFALLLAWYALVRYNETTEKFTLL